MWNKKFMVIIIALAPMIVADPPLVGRWIEDETLRTGLYDFLWARGKFSTERQHPIAMPFGGPHHLPTYFPISLLINL